MSRIQLVRLRRYTRVFKIATADLAIARTAHALLRRRPRAKARMRPLSLRYLNSSYVDVQYRVALALRLYTFRLSLYPVFTLSLLVDQMTR